MKLIVIIYKILSFIIVLCVILDYFTPLKVNASDNKTGNNFSFTKTILNAYGEEVLRITMKSGEIKIVANSHTATNKVKWETIGFTISKVQLDDIPYEYRATEKKYPLSGWEDMNTIPSKYKGDQPLMFTDGDKEPDDVNEHTGITTTTINFSVQKVSTALGENLNDIKNGETIYLNTIFDVYTEDSQGHKSVHPEQEYIQNWRDILLAEYWDRSDNQLDDFAKFYNIPLKFDPPLVTNNTLYYVDENGNDIGLPSSELPSASTGESISWDNKPNSTPYKGKKYVLNGFYAKKKSGGKITDSDYLGKGEDISKLRHSTMVYLGGINVYLVYRNNPPNIPTPTPPVATAPTPTPKLEDITVPKPDSEVMSLNSASATGEIRADDRGNEKFTATTGIPTTESLYGQVTATEYLLGYKFEKKVGKIYYSIPVTKNYILKWKSATPDSAGGGKTQTKTVPVTQYISVPRVYGYWEITKLEYYNIDNAELSNYALPGGKLIMTPNSSYYNPPSISYYHTAETNYHIIPPAELLKGIALSTETITGGTSKPVIPQEDFSDYALLQTSQIKVRSDSLIFGGNTVISDTITETEAPNINTSAIPQCTTNTNQNALYKSDQVIMDTKSNGEYASSGNISYKALALIGSSNPQIVNYAINGINNVVIHTPVLCDPIVKADNDKYVQLLKPTKNCVELVLDPNSTLNDFTLEISNTGYHSSMSGYYSRDFSKSLHDNKSSYIAEENGLLRNEVKFPFDVFIDKGSDNNKNNDDYVKADSWITIGKSTVRFYLPTWIIEGVYTVECRTIAVNVGDFIHNTENFANRIRRNYVATNTFHMEVSGRIYGLSLYDISDYPTWEEVFRIPNSSDLKKNSSKYPDGTCSATYNKDNSYTYTVGTNDQYGNDNGRDVKYTFPLVNGSHPTYKNQGILKTGYMIRFSLDTVGNMFSDDTSVIIKPSFYFIDKNGKNRTAVDLYYTEEVNGKTKSLVKVGGNTDKTNIKAYNTGDLKLGIPPSEMKLTSALRNQRYGEFYWQNSPMYTFAKIQLNNSFRTFIGQKYKDNIKKLSCFDDIQKSGVKESDADKSMQRWYGQYYIPNEVHAVNKGYNVMDYAKKYGVDYDEEYWLTDGYIFVNFEIYTIQNGKQHLSYINADNYLDHGNCSMWVMEGAPLSKKSNKGPTFHLYAGDVCIYYGNKKMGDDYTPGAIY